MMYSIIAFVMVFALLASGLLLLFYRKAPGQRLSRVLTPRRGPSFLERFKSVKAAETLGAAAESIRKSTSQNGPSAVQQRLIYAGYRRDYQAKVFSTCKIVVPLLLPAIAVLSGAYRWNPFIVIAGALGIGYLLPDYWLDRRVKARESAIRRGLPDMLDLMVVCLEAGLSIDQATIRASEEMRFSHREIADELGLVMLEVRAGQSRTEAWKRLSERNSVEAVRMLVTILLQADQFGTGISRTLRTHSDTMRTQRRQKVEELAAKTSVKLVFPLAMFIMPSFFVVVLGPAVISMSEAFSRGR